MAMEFKGKIELDIRDWTLDWSPYLADTASSDSPNWPKGIQARGEVPSQYHHCTDIVPTIYGCCGITPPKTVLGYEQSELPGVSMRYSFDAGDAPTTKETQYYEMPGTRGIWHQGWKAVTEHAPMNSDKGHFDQDRWQLFHTDEDLCDLGLLHYISYEFHPPVPKSGLYTYVPDTAEVPERSGAANVHAVSYKILAEVQIDDASAQAVIMAQGSRFGGHALFIKDRKLHYVYNFLGPKPEQHFESAPLEPGTCVLGVEFIKERQGERRESHGTAKLYLGEDIVAEGALRTQTGHFSLCGEGLSIGRDTGDPGSEQYTPFFGFEGGTILKLEVGIADDAYIDLEPHLAAALARD